MGIDLYVGTLTRYYTRRWETAQQQAIAAAGGPLASVVSPRDAFPMKGLSYGEAHRVVQDWRMGMGRAMRKQGVEFGGWKEDVAQPYATTSLTRDGYGALMLWAAYQEAPELMPRQITPEDWAADPAYEHVSGPGACFASLYDAQAWLPVELAEPVVMPMSGGEQHVVAPVGGLDRALRDLNACTWKVAEADRDAWLSEAAQCIRFEDAARLAFDSFRRQVDFAVKHGLPVMMDW